MLSFLLLLTATRVKNDLAKALWSLIFGFFLVPNGVLAASISLKDEYDTLTRFQAIVFWGLQDNMDGIFANPLSRTLASELSQNQQLMIKEQINPAFNPLSLDAEKRKKLIPSGFDGALWGQIIKLPQVIQVQWYLYDREGRVFLTKQKDVSSGPTQSNILASLHEGLGSLFAELPYQALVIGKKNRLITINAGEAQGLTAGQVLDVVWVSRIDRHPVQDFVTHFELIPLGKILIQTLEKNMSFGSLIEERFPGWIKPGAKIWAKAPAKYPPLTRTSSGALIENGAEGPTPPILIGQIYDSVHPKAPEYGWLAFEFLTGPMEAKQTQVGRGNVKGSSPFSLGLGIRHQLWLTTHWTFDIETRVRATQLELSGPSTQGSLNAHEQWGQLGVHYKMPFQLDPTDSYFYAGPRLSFLQWNVEQNMNSDLSGHQWTGLSMALGLRYVPTIPWAITGWMEIPLLSQWRELGADSGSVGAASLWRFGVKTDFFIQSLRSVFVRFEHQSFSGSLSGTGSRPFPATHSSVQTHQLSVGLSQYF